MLKLKNEVLFVEIFHWNEDRLLYSITVVHILVCATFKKKGKKINGKYETLPI